MFWYSHLFKSVPQFLMFHTVRGFSLVSETEEDVFLEFPFFLYNPANVGNLISGSSSFSKPILDIRKFLICIILKPGMQDFKHDLTSMGNEYDCPMVSIFFYLFQLEDNYNIVLVLPYISMNLPQVYTCSPS